MVGKGAKLVVGSQVPGSAFASEWRRRLKDLAMKSSNEDYKAHICFEIELALAEPEFLGVPVGSTLGDILSSVIYRGVMAPSIALAAKTRSLRWIHRWRGVELSRDPGVVGELSPGRVLIANISTRPYHQATTPLLVREIGACACHVMTDDLALQEMLPEESGRLRWRDAPPPDLESWRQAYDSCSGQWHQTLRALRRRFGLSKTAVALLDDAILVSSQRIVRYEALLDRLKPSAVMVEYDRNVRGSCLVLAARQRGIPTFTLVHGVINGPFGFAPVLADTILCWGEIQRRHLIGFGTSPDRVKVVGFERITDSLQVGPATVRCGLGVANDAAVALLATNPIEHAAKERFARMFCEGVSRTPGVQGLVRLHPSESLTDYANVAESFPNVRFMANHELTLDEALAAADVVVVHSSGFGGEALVKGRLAIVLDAIDYPLGHGRDLITYGNVPRTTCAEELSAVLIRIWSEPGFREHLAKSAKEYVRKMFFAFDDDARKNIAAVVRARAQTSPNCDLPSESKAKVTPDFNRPTQSRYRSGGGI